jgi:hypothetical protein
LKDPICYINDDVAAVHMGTVHPVDTVVGDSLQVAAGDILHAVEGDNQHAVEGDSLHAVVEDSILHAVEGDNIPVVVEDSLHVAVEDSIPVADKAADIRHAGIHLHHAESGVLLGSDDQASDDQESVRHGDARRGGRDATYFRTSHQDSQTRNEG